VVSPACAALSGYFAGKRVATFQSRQALISPDLDRAWLVGGDPNGALDLYELRLPSGKLIKRVASVTGISWLGAGPDLLAARMTDPVTGAYELLRVPASSGKVSVLAGGPLCKHLSAPDGKRVFHVRACKDKIGTLEQLDVSSGKVTKLDNKVGVWDLRINRAGTLLSYLADIGKQGLCSFNSGTLRMRLLTSGLSVTVGSNAAEDSAQFLPDGERMLFRRYHDCVKYVDRLLVARPVASAPVKLVDRWSKCFDGNDDWISGDLSYAVSPDGARVLVADLIQGSSSHARLDAVRTDGKGVKTLTDRLVYWPKAASSARVWGLTGDGSHAVFLAEDTHVAAAALAGGKLRRLGKTVATTGAFALSWRGALVAHRMGSGAGPHSLWISDLASSAAAEKVWSSPGAIGHATWLPDDRGLLVQAADGAGRTGLHFVRRTGGAGVATPIGGWKKQWMLPGLPYAVDAAGCVAVYNREQNAQPGTYLFRLPR